jgi:hypothetical protein
MIDCAIQERLSLAIDLYCHQAGREVEADCLSSEDWIVLTNIHHFLRFFHQATLATEGYTATLERVLSTMEFLLEQLELGKLEYSNDPYIGPCINSAWSKLDKHYGLTERSSAYIATMVLIPSQKWTWIEDNWEPDWIIAAKASVQDLWDSQYKPPYQPVIPLTNKPIPTSRSLPADDYFTLDNAKNNDTAIEAIGTELKFRGKVRRIRCFGHILNLVCKQLLFGHDADAFGEEVSADSTIDASRHEAWRRKGPIGKLHNLVVVIHRSDVLSQLLRNTAISIQ